MSMHYFYSQQKSNTDPFTHIHIAYMCGNLPPAQHISGKEKQNQKLFTDASLFSLPLFLPKASVGRLETSDLRLWSLGGQRVGGGSAPASRGACLSVKGRDFSISRAAPQRCGSEHQALSPWARCSPSPGGVLLLVPPRGLLGHSTKYSL